MKPSVMVRRWAHYLEKTATILWDMEKFYDNVLVQILIPEVEASEYPVRLGYMGLVMHMAPRVLRGYNHHEICDDPTNAIIAGCTQSTYFAKVMFRRVIQSHLGRVSKQNLRTFIDDIAQRFYGSRQRVIDKAV